MRTILLAAALVGMTAEVARAQIIRPVRRNNPMAWTSLSVGFLQQQSFHDPQTNSSWEFGSAAQWRATLELPLGSGAALGVTGTMARIGMIYHGQPQIVDPRSCSSCEADANISQLLATLRLGGGSALHQVIDLSAGYTFFHNFKSEAGQALGPDKAINDFTFGLGYGFGYSFSPRAQVFFVQDIALIIHRAGDGDLENIPQQRVTRIGGRFALGSRN